MFASLIISHKVFTVENLDTREENEGESGNVVIQLSFLPDSFNTHVGLDTYVLNYARLFSS